MSYSVFETLSYFFGGMLTGSAVFYVYHIFFKQRRERALEKETDRILNKAKSEAYRIEKKAEIRAKDWKIKMQNEAKKEIIDEKNKLQEETKKLQLRSSQLRDEYQQKMEDWRSRMQELESSQTEIQEKHKNLDLLQKKRQDHIQQLSQQLENLTQMTREEVEEELKKTLEMEIRTALAPQFKKMEDEFKQKKEEKCRNILAVAMARHASAVTNRTYCRSPAYIRR